MNAALRHLCLRLWATAFAGGLVCVIVLPWWQRLVSLEGILFPVALLLTASFAAAGAIMNNVGKFFLRRLVNEAAVWEQAGMKAEAEAAYQRAAGIFDSFWFSPMQRRRRMPSLTARLARFYIGQRPYHSHTDIIVKSYLFKHPDDGAVASAWLEQLLNRKCSTQIDHEAAACIGRALADDSRIQQLLMEFYLINGRVDFHAVQTYQRVWQQHHPLPAGLLESLVGLLLQDAWLTHWALQVYLEAHRQGHPEALEGLAGCVCWLRPTTENRPHLQAAKIALAKHDTKQVALLARRFKPVQPTRLAARLQKPARGGPKRQNDGISASIAEPLSRTLESWTALALKLGRGMAAVVCTRRAVAGVAVGAAVMVTCVAGYQMIKMPVDPTEPVVPKQAAPAVKDPFTIQVAAYLKIDDARRFVDRLKQSDLDAFWTEATSANRRWYQVKISHFATKQQAMAYGRQLKSKGLIDDYYVANYSRR
jgi:hypothetical protein